MTKISEIKLSELNEIIPQSNIYKHNDGGWFFLFK